MKNKIRLYRQRNGMTLKVLADAMGTTPQTVSRLETGNMTLSTDWLERFARVLDLHPTDLLEGRGSRDIAMLGRIGPDGLANPTREESLTIDVAGEDPVAARIDQAHGPFRAGEILIGNRLVGAAIGAAVGHDCLTKIVDGPVLLRRVVAANGADGQGADTPEDARYTLVPLEADSGGRRVEIRYNQRLEWCARLTMRLIYL